VNVKLGTYTGTGADNRSITGVGFQPDFVLVKGGANRAVICTDTMDTGDAKCITGANGMETDQIQALEADGFQVGTSARVNANTTVYYYLALRDDGNGDFCTFSYTGNGADDRNITNAALTFDPNLVIVLPDNTSDPTWRSTDFAAGSSITFDGSPQTNRIQALGTTNFQVGTDASVNENLTVMHAACFKNVANVCKVLTYTGDGLDDRTLTGAGFEPDFAFTKRHTAATASPGIARFKDETTRFKPSPATAFRLGRTPRSTPTPRHSMPLFWQKWPQPWLVAGRSLRTAAGSDCSRRF
jgi:hypothetical protein